MLHASVAVHVLVIDLVHPVPCSAPSTELAVNPVEQLSLTVAVPNAELIWLAVGLHGGVVAAVTVITGVVTSLVKVIVCVCVPVLLHASITVQLLVTDLMQPVPCSGPSTELAVNPVEQLSLTVAVPNALVICAAVGLHGGLVAAVTLITGAVTSLVNVMVCV